MRPKSVISWLTVRPGADAVVHDRIVQTAGGQAAAVVRADAGEVAGQGRLVGRLYLRGTWYAAAAL